MPISFSGHCCTESFVISIIDKNSYFDQCRFVLSNQPLTVVRIPTTNIQTTEKEPTPVSVSIVNCFIFRRKSYWID